jgi:hypothetical protein
MAQAASRSGRATFHFRLKYIMFACGLAVVYLALWALTWILGGQTLRAQWERFASSVELQYEDEEPHTVCRLNTFDREQFEHPGKGRALLYRSRVTSPCPFVLSADFAASYEGSGWGRHRLVGWWFGKLRILNDERTWGFGDGDDDPIVN